MLSYCRKNTLRVYGFAVFYQERADALGVVRHARLVADAGPTAVHSAAPPVQHEPSSTTINPTRGADLEMYPCPGWVLS